MGTPDHPPTDVGGPDDAAAQMLSKLAAMEVARRAEREQRQQAAKELADPRESVEGFLAWSAQQQTEVQQRCAQVQAGSPSSDAGGTDAVPQQQQQQQLDALLEQVGVMERAVAEASYFLPPYDLRQATATAQELRQQLEAAKSALLPKRKFAFSSKRVSRVKASEAAAAGTFASASGSSDGVQPAGTGTSAAGSEPAVAGSASGAPYASAGGQGTTPAISAATADPAAATAAATAAAVLTVSAHDQELIRAGHGLMGLRDREVVVWAAQHAGADFVVIDCQRCSIWLLGPMLALRIQGLVDCKLYAGPIGGAAFVSGAVSSTLMLATQQARFHSSSGSELYLSVRSKPIIEHCSGLRFAPFVDVALALPSCSGDGGAAESRHTGTRDGAAPSSDNAGSGNAGSSSGAGSGNGSSNTSNAEISIDSSAGSSSRQEGSSGAAHGVSGAANGTAAVDVAGLWCQVEDFGWIKATQSPHWSVLPVHDRVQPRAPPQNQQP